jgi:phage shock protein PspC (stress-responsive transcriptional regulator)
MKQEQKLYKIKEGKKICGVCTGLAEYLEVDVTLIRLVWLFSVLFLGTGILAYFIVALILPKKDKIDRPSEDKIQEVEYKEI